MDCVISTRRAVQADSSGGALQCCWATSERDTSAEAGDTGRGSTAVGSDESDVSAVELSAHPLDS